MNARIRAAVVGDVDGMLALEALFPGDQLTRRGFQHLLRSPSARVWVAIAAKEIVGDLVLLLRRGSTLARIYSVVVAPAARGQRLGDRLVAAAERRAAAGGCQRLRLEVRSDNPAARALYARRGYRLLNTLPGYYEDGAEGLRLEKTLA